MPRVKRIHVICKGAAHVVEVPDGRFETKFWKVSYDAAESASFIALHESKGEASYLQGKIVSFHPVEYQGQMRFAIIVEPTAESVEWEGDGAGEKGYGY